MAVLRSLTNQYGAWRGIEGHEGHREAWRAQRGVEGVEGTDTFLKGGGEKLGFYVN